MAKIVVETWELHSLQKKTRDNLHSIISRVFGRPNERQGGIGASLAEIPKIRTLSPIKDPFNNSLNARLVKLETDLSKDLHIEVVYCLGNNKGGKSKGAYSNKIRDKSYAVKYFVETTGLDLTEDRVYSIEKLPNEFGEKVRFVDIFKITGKFRVMDEQLFTKALLHGIGRRVSYGFGLLEIKEKGEK